MDMCSTAETAHATYGLLNNVFYTVEIHISNGCYENSTLSIIQFAVQHCVSSSSNTNCQSKRVYSNNNCACGFVLSASARPHLSPYHNKCIIMTRQYRFSQLQSTFFLLNYILLRQSSCSYVWLLDYAAYFFKKACSKCMSFRVQHISYRACNHNKFILDEATDDDSLAFCFCFLIRASHLNESHQSSEGDGD